MEEQTEKYHQKEMTTLGMAFMGFMMGVGAILGIWFLSGLVPLVSMMLGN